MINATTKSRGRPATGKGTPIQVRLQPEMLEKVDRWLEGIANLSGKPMNSRAHAIRAILKERFDYGPASSLVRVEGELGAYHVSFLDLPDVTASGETIAEALENAANILKGHHSKSL